MAAEIGVQRIYLISRACDTIRREDVLTQLRTLGLGDLTEHFVAVEPNPATEPLFASFNSKVKFARPEKLASYRRGALGCLLSHVGVAKLALERGESRILVLEDDLCISANFANELRSAISALDRCGPEWAVLYVEHSKATTLSRHQAYTYTDAWGARVSLWRTHGNYNTAGMVLTQQALQKIAQEATGLCTEIDLFMSLKIAQHSPCFMLPAGTGVVQAGLLSTITGTVRKGVPAWVTPLFVPRSASADRAFHSQRVQAISSSSTRKASSAVKSVLKTRSVRDFRRF